MKKDQNSNKKPDKFTRLMIKNWIICIISLLLVIFFLYFYK